MKLTDILQQFQSCFQWLSIFHQLRKTEQIYSCSASSTPLALESIQDKKKYLD